MPNLYQNFLRGTLTADPGAGGATLTSAELASMVTVASPDFMWVTLDPDGVNGAPELVKITTHSAAATTAAMTRAQQGTVARAHPIGTTWRHTWTRDDGLLSKEFSGLEAALPTASAALEGYTYYATDTERVRLCDGTGWVIMSEPSQSFTPTWASGLTTTSGTNVGTYKRSDGWIDVQAQFTFGASSAVTGNVVFQYPIAAFATPTTPQFQAAFFDTSASTTFSACATTPSTTQVSLCAVGAGATYASIAFLTSTIPFAWGTGDTITVAARYRMTTRYS
jgi:hypothetical protein